ncbi:hydroxyisourate hydrolase [Aeromicrobium sp. Sec7.5]|uniref:hydroxyisourate hydrolase n=1 Tax=Aeromicrobium sp. Sec7.5 TaxID=3121276 RepID=UPI002FE455D3
MPSLSTHVLDAARGAPASGLAVDLLEGDVVLESAVTDPDGRVAWGSAPGAGVLRVRFATGPWFAAAGRETFFPVVEVTAELTEGSEHVHLALLLSPFAYTTYRGS